MDKKQKIMDLWKNNFHDSDAFIRFYFDRKYRDEDALLYESGELPASALLMLPYPMSWADRLLQTSYISGACTRAEFRNQGLMTVLLKKAFREMYRKDIALSTLIPAEEWLFGYYARLGYTSVFDYSLEAWEPEAEPASSGMEISAPESFQREFTAELYPYFQQQTAVRPYSVRHPLEDYLAIVEEVYHSGGRLLAAYSGSSGQPSGWALALRQDQQVIVKEILYDSPEVKNTLCLALSRLWGTTSVICRIPPNGKITYPYGMARVIHAGQLLQQLAGLFPSFSGTIRLTDPQLAVNTGFYTLSKGRCLRHDSIATSTVYEMDIPTLTRALLGLDAPAWFPPLPKASPYMNLMLD